MLYAYDEKMTQGDYVFWTFEDVPNDKWVNGNESWIGDDNRNEEALSAMKALFHVKQFYKDDNNNFTIIRVKNS